MVGAQIGQAVFLYLADMLREAVDAEVSGEAELGCDDDIIQELLDWPADELFVFAPAIEFGGIEKGHTQTLGAADGLEPVFRVGRAICQVESMAP